jgi:MoxR-like ATPase
MSTPAQDFETHLLENSGRVVFGAEDIIHSICIALIAQGHVLLQGVPGLGKTLLAKTLAAQLGGDFRRIQCTADLMPSDMTGINVFNAVENKFTFMPGPMFSDVLLVDEINRTGPKTQSALLQAMEEYRVTIDRETYKLSDNFFVIATQNPYEFEGTYPLPESQLDRFMLQLNMSYPSADMEQQVLRQYDAPGSTHKQDIDVPTIPAGMLEAARAQATGVHVSDAIYKYVSDIASASRVHAQVNLGLSSRGALALMRSARVEAALRGGEFVTPDDIKTVANPVMAHRLLLSADAALEGIEGESIVEAIFNQVDVPRDLDTATAR